MPSPDIVARSALRAALRGALPVLAIALCACGGAFADAMKRGDQYAQAAMWDKAAAEYQAAQRLEPDNPDVTIKLRQVAQKRAGERLTRAKALIARGEIEAGLAVIQDAVRLDPSSTEAQQALDDANQQVIARAEELLETPDAAKALELTQLVLAGSPKDRRARAADDRVRDALADKAYAQAEQFAGVGKRGNALIAYAACMTYRPNFRDARAQIGDVKLALQQELTFHVVLDRFAVSGPGESDLAAHLRPELVAQAFDDHLPLRVVASAPGPGVRGVRLTGALSAYRFGPERAASRNEQCTYVRGHDSVPNPLRAMAERDVAAAEQQLARAERSIDDLQRDVDRAQKEVDDQQKEQARYEADSDRARSDYDRCMANASKTTSSPCSYEKSRLESAQSQVGNQRNRVQSARDSALSTRERMQRSAEDRARARQQVEEAQRQMRNTPEMIQQPHHERENFTVEIRSIDAAVILQLRAESLQGRTVLLDNETFPQAIKPISDEGWLARPATCPPDGKRIRLPGEAELRGELLKMTIATLREKVMTMYESYRTKFLADARRQEAGGAPEDAVESYVRYLLTGIKNIDPGNARQIGEFLRKTRGFGRIDLLGSL
jgi:tetratricopeptide (TPR) repeat protein